MTVFRHWMPHHCTKDVCGVRCVKARVAAWCRCSTPTHPTPTAHGNPEYVHCVLLRAVRMLPPLVSPEEVEALREQLALAAAGHCFVLQAGDCAERFHDSASDRVDARLQLLHQMVGVGVRLRAWRVCGVRGPCRIGLGTFGSLPAVRIPCGTPCAVAAAGRDLWTARGAHRAYGRPVLEAAVVCHRGGCRIVGHFGVGPCRWRRGNAHLAHSSRRGRCAFA